MLLKGADMKLRMTSSPVTATSFTNEDERVAALAFAQDYRSANYLSHQPRVQDSAYGNNLVHLPTFTGDIWVTKAS